MKRSTKKTLLLSAALLLAGAVSIGFYMYNKGPVNVRTAAAIKTEAPVFYQEYQSDTIAANKKYAGRVVQVRGQVSQVSQNQQSETVVLLATSGDGAFINCTLEETGISTKAGNIINVKGICSGMGAGEPDLGIKGDIYLTRGYITDK